MKINPNDIVKSHRLYKILALTDDKIFDFIPALTLACDMPVIPSWAEYFIKYNVPFVITANSEGCTLWKELLEPPMKNNGKKFKK